MQTAPCRPLRPAHVRFGCGKTTDPGNFWYSVPEIREILDFLRVYLQPRLKRQALHTFQPITPGRRTGDRSDGAARRRQGSPRFAHRSPRTAAKQALARCRFAPGVIAGTAPPGQLRASPRRRYHPAPTGRIGLRGLLNAGSRARRRGRRRGAASAMGLFDMPVAARDAIAACSGRRVRSPAISRVFRIWSIAAASPCLLMP